MEFTTRGINLFTLYKLPSAFLAGVRMKTITDKVAVVTVKHRWLNQNPFRSMFWAIQGMAAELSTGVLVMRSINDSGKKVSMLVVDMNANFSKKATGRIIFTCDQAHLVKSELNKSIDTGEERTFVLTSIGLNEEGIQVSKFEFKWSIKVKA